MLLLVIVIIICYVCLWAFLSVNPLIINNTRATRDDLSKYYILSKINDKYKPTTLLINKDDIHKLIYPKYFKPNRCAGHGYMVKLIKNIADAKKYFKQIKDKSKIICQDVAPGTRELRLMFRRDFTKKCRITSITEKIKNKNSLFLADRNDLINKKNTRLITSIINSISKDINYCGLDIMYESDDDFKNGKNFDIIEINGNSSISPEIYFGGNITLNVMFDIIMSNIMVGLYNIIYNKGISNIKLLYSLPNRLHDYFYIRKDITILFADWD